MYIERYRNRFIVVYQTQECGHWGYMVFSADIPHGGYSSVEEYDSSINAFKTAKRDLDFSHSHIEKNKESTFKIYGKKRGGW